MIILRTDFGEEVILNRGVFSVPDSAALEKLLNTISKVEYQRVHGGSPNPDFDLLQRMKSITPAMKIISDDYPLPQDTDDSRVASPESSFEITRHLDDR